MARMPTSTVWHRVQDPPAEGTVADADHFADLGRPRPGDLARARQLGIAASLLKPLQRSELIETILWVMGHEAELEQLPDGPAVVRPPAPEGVRGLALRILVAEDNEFNRDLLEYMLAGQGLSATMVVDGRETLRILERERFDLLLLDIHMPELDGFQVVEAIRKREQTTGDYLPVIALTARSRSEDREKCVRSGMDDYLTKPFKAADLWAAIDRVVRRRPQEKTDRLDPIDPQVLLAACGVRQPLCTEKCAPVAGGASAAAPGGPPRGIAQP